MTQIEAKSKGERFIASQIDPRLACDEVILHTGYLTGDLHASSQIGAIAAGIGLRACFIARDLPDQAQMIDALCAIAMA